MTFLQRAIVGLVRPYVVRELPGWGHVYGRFVGSYQSNEFWESAQPRVIRDKRYGMLRLVDLREWADRIFFFLGRWYDLETQLVLDLVAREGEVILDVGANYGHFALSAAALVGSEGAVIAVEPNPRAFARLQTHIELNRLDNVEALNAGFSDSDGELVLSIPRINSGEASFARTHYADTKEVCCPVYLGDERVAKRRVTFIKIDVEGFELRVLKGLSKTIERDRPWILIEMVREHLDRDGSAPADIAEQLRPLGYTPMRLELCGRPVGAKRLVLKSYDPTDDNCDVLWVPDAKLGHVETAMAGRNVF